MKDFAQFYGIAADNSLTVDVINSIANIIMIDLFNKQELVCNHSETSKYPILSDDAYDVISTAFDDAVGDLKYEVIMGFLDMFYRNVINPGVHRAELESYFNQDYPDWEDDLTSNDYTNHKRIIRAAHLEEDFCDGRR